MTRLAVRRLTLSHFRSHRRAEIETDGASVALIGPNGAGKTNILEAASLLAPGRGLRGAASEDLVRAPERLGWRVTAAVETPDRVLEILVGADAPDAPRRRVEIDGAAATQAALGAHVSAVWLTPAMDRLWIEGAAGRRRFLDRLTLAFAPGHGEASSAYERAMRERNRLLKDGRFDPSWLGALEARMAEAGAAIARAREACIASLAAAQEGAETAFPRAEIAASGALERRFASVRADGGDPAEIEPEVEAAFRLELESGRMRDAQAGRALDGPHRSDLAATYAEKAREARLCSTGEQKALLISLVLASARALRATGAPAPLLLLDEVAAHLDEARRAALFAEIAALGAQAWMTGTEPALFAPLAPSALRLALAETADGSRIAALAP